MGKRAFWPGFRWRILAHKRHDIGKAKLTSYLENGKVEVQSHEFGCPVEFDELVIDDWAHLEQMSDRHWWMQVGNQDGNTLTVHVTIDRDGVAAVEIHWE